MTHEEVVLAAIEKDREIRTYECTDKAEQAEIFIKVGEYEPFSREAQPDILGYAYVPYGGKAVECNVEAVRARKEDVLIAFNAFAFFNITGESVRVPMKVTELWFKDGREYVCLMKLLPYGWPQCESL